MPHDRPPVDVDVVGAINRLQKADSVGVVERELATYPAHRGDECFLISRMPRARGDNPAPLLIWGRYAEQWLEQYNNDRIYLHDPIEDRGQMN